MSVPVQVTFRRVPISDEVMALCRREAARLRQRWDALLAVDVLVEQPHRRPRRGVGLQVRVRLHLPRKQLVARRAAFAGADAGALLGLVAEALVLAEDELRAYARRRSPRRRFPFTPAFNPVSSSAGDDIALLSSLPER